MSSSLLDSPSHPTSSTLPAPSHPSSQEDPLRSASRQLAELEMLSNCMDTSNTVEIAVEKDNRYVHSQQDIYLCSFCFSAAIVKLFLRPF